MKNKNLENEANDPSEIKTYIQYQDTPNKSISIMVHNDGDANMAIHQIKSFDYKGSQILKSGKKVESYEITQTDGRLIYLNLFFTKED